MRRPRQVGRARECAGLAPACCSRGRAGEPPAHAGTPPPPRSAARRRGAPHLVALAALARLVEHHQPHVDAHLRRRQAYAVVPAATAAAARGAGGSSE